MEVIGVEFKEAGKIYYYKMTNDEFSVGDKVVAETIRGIEIGEVVNPSKIVDPDNFGHPIESIKRKATLRDLKRAEENEKEAKEAFEICLDKIEEHNLPMRLVDSEYTLDRGKLLFYFTADDRVDFRELVKDLASIFKTRIELRQIGVRDEAKMRGGLGPCGRVLCCSKFLRDFDPISIKMAKEQDLSLNPNKISGICGRLMCCLKYETNSYKQIKNELPNVGEKVETNFGTGNVEDINVIKKTLKVDLGDDEKIEIDFEDIES
ncbi:putative PSP1-like protein [Halobacteroides halobius DSM 5150]|uniref:Putative PSP1-like protein n=1 Tax=Halobacteroides halobius (strain ATCC 35273 / DSM 5150 / MD-1) TaxID=748449 RepID=L0K7I0_HALHC|nr:stage 0 sporulation family protein [Halobacteroides halobius]AGB40083.1 putative PSP1-like protein [Halobacteroides halobius DSM 5150]